MNFALLKATGYGLAMMMQNRNGAPSPTPQQIVALAKKGDFAAAVQVGEALLKMSRPNAAILHLVGTVACQAGQLDRGIELLRSAADCKPDDVEIRLNLARALTDMSRYDEVIALCAPLSDRDIRFAWSLGNALKKLLRLTEAVALFEKAVRQAPGNAELWNNLGTVKMDLGDIDGAMSALKQADKLSNGRSEIRANLARLLQKAGREDEAVTILLDLIKKGARDSSICLLAGQLLTSLGRPEDALPLLGESVRQDHDNAEAFVATAIAFAALGDLERAEQGYGFALKIEPHHETALLNLGTLYEQGNRLDALNILIDDARSKGAAGDALRLLEAMALRRNGEIERAFEQLKSVSGTDVDERILVKMRAELADRINRPDIAFSSFERMNILMAQDPSARMYDGTEHRVYTNALTAMITPEWVQGWPAHRSQDARKPPVFLVGFPRSGTTLLDTVLMGHSATHVLEERPVLARVREAIGGLDALPDLTPSMVDDMRNLYYSELARLDPAPSGATVIDKLPLNILNLPLVKRLFPDSRIIFALRHPCDAVLSCFMQNFKMNQAMASFLTLENSACFYDAVMRNWEKSKDVLDLDHHVVRYESLVADREATLRPLFDYLELPWEDGALAHARTAMGRGQITTPSYAQVTEPIYTRAIGRWEKYATYMAPILPVLTPWAEHFGYVTADVG